MGLRRVNLQRGHGRKHGVRVNFFFSIEAVRFAASWVYTTYIYGMGLATGIKSIRTGPLPLTQP